MREVKAELNEAAVRFEDLGPRVARVGWIVGILGLLASLLLGLLTSAGIPRLLQSYLVSFAFFLSLSLGALFFVVLQHLTRSGWSVVVRRLGETLAMNLPWFALFFLPILFFLPQIYRWADPQAIAGDALLLGKRPYLNPTFFVIRWVVFFGAWTFLARYFWNRSIRQDGNGDVRLTLQMERTAGPAMVLFALTVNFASFDLLMSIDPAWYSTIFGVYYFSGSAVGFFALLSVMVILLQRAGRLGGLVTDEHYHDLGKLVFAFIVFWTYIAFSQFLLIWYANIPEETRWYDLRVNGAWRGIGLLLLFGHFVLPFGFLLPRSVKRRPKLFGPMAVWVLLMCYIDIYWLVLPQSSSGRVPWNLLDLTCPLGIGGIWLALAARRLVRHSLVPKRDPRLAESIAFENA